MNNETRNPRLAEYSEDLSIDSLKERGVGRGSTLR